VGAGGGAKLMLVGAVFFIIEKYYADKT